MKISLIILFVFCSSLLLTNAQQENGYIFKIELHPNSKYTTTHDIKMTSEMNIISDNPESSGTYAVESNYLMKQISMTGEKRNDGSFPVEMEIVDINQETKINGEKSPSIDKSEIIGLKIKANCVNNKLTDFDISGGDQIEEIKEQIENAIENILMGIKYPETPIKIGESFKMEIPATIPSSGVSLNLKLTMNYTLKKVEGNMAFFDK